MSASQIIATGIAIAIILLTFPVVVYFPAILQIIHEYINRNK